MSKGNYVPACKGMVMEIFYRNDTFCGQWLSFVRPGILVTLWFSTFKQTH